MKTVFADQGCYVTSGPFKDKIFYVPQTSSSNQFYSGNESYSADCRVGSSQNSYYRLTSELSSTQCFVQLKTGAPTNSTNPGDYVDNGNLVDFDVENCPFDNDTIAFLLPALVVISAFRLKANEKR